LGALSSQGSPNLGTAVHPVNLWDVELDAAGRNVQIRFTA